MLKKRTKKNWRLLKIPYLEESDLLIMMSNFQLRLQKKEMPRIFTAEEGSSFVLPKNWGYVTGRACRDDENGFLKH